MSGSEVQLLVEEAPEEELVLDRVDVREAGEVADDRGHRGAAAAARRQQRARRVRPPHLDRHVARELQQVAVQDEEAGQAERLDHPQLLLQARVRVRVAGVRGRVALVHPRPAQLRQRAPGARVLGARVAVAEVRVQVEAQAVGQLQRLRDRLRVVLEAGRHRRRRGEHVGEVAAPHGLGGVQRRVVAQRHERVLQRGARARVRVDVPRRHAREPEPRGERGQPAVERAVVALERALELHAQPVAPEGGQQPPHRRLVAHALPRAAAQAHEPGGVLLDRLQRHRRRRLVPLPRVRVRAREDPAEVAPALRVLHQQRQVAAVVEVDLRAVDGAQPERPGRLGELHRARDGVVVRERHRPVAQLGRGARQLVGQRGAVQEREGGVGVELGVRHEHMFASSIGGTQPAGRAGCETGADARVAAPQRGGPDARRGGARPRVLLAGRLGARGRPVRADRRRRRLDRRHRGDPRRDRRRRRARARAAPLAPVRAPDGDHRRPRPRARRRRRDARRRPPGPARADPRAAGALARRRRHRRRQAPGARRRDAHEARHRPLVLRDHRPARPGRARARRGRLPAVRPRAAGRAAAHARALALPARHELVGRLPARRRRATTAPPAAPGRRSSRSRGWSASRSTG